MTTPPKILNDSKEIWKNFSKIKLPVKKKKMKVPKEISDALRKNVNKALLIELVHNGLKIEKEGKGV